MLQSALKWVSEQGYPLEMRVAKIFRHAGFDVRQGQFYMDGKSGEWREIDLLAISPDFIGITKITFAVECKSSNKPWVLFTSNVGTERNVFFTYALMSEAARKVLIETTFKDPDNTTASPRFAIFDRLRWIDKPQETAYSARQVFTEKDSAYTALSASIKAATHLVRSDKIQSSAHFRIVFPIVVIDSPLLLCGLDKTNEIEIRRVDSGEVLFTNPDNAEELTCIRIVTLESLPAFVTEAREEARQLVREFKPHEAIYWREQFGDEIVDYPIL